MMTVGRKIAKYVKRFAIGNAKSKKTLKAIGLISEKKLYKIKTRSSFISKEIYLVKGNKMNYIAIKNYWCSCNGFLKSVINNKEKPCYHLIACYLNFVRNDQNFLPYNLYEVFDAIFKNNKYDLSV